WFLWVFHSKEAVVFVLSSGRAHDVPEDHLGPVKEGILSVDRYSAYKAMKQVKDGLILLAFCWAHVRRDFLEAARAWPTEGRWTGSAGLVSCTRTTRLAWKSWTASPPSSPPEMRNCGSASSRWPSEPKRSWLIPRYIRREKVR